MKTLDDPEDRNSGVRELSEDENGLRELNEDDMSDMDEFIVFATQPQTSDEPQYHLNRLYTFSKQSTSNQVRANALPSESFRMVAVLVDKLTRG